MVEAGPFQATLACPRSTNLGRCRPNVAPFVGRWFRSDSDSTAFHTRGDFRRIGPNSAIIGQALKNLVREVRSRGCREGVRRHSLSALRPFVCLRRRFWSSGVGRPRSRRPSWVPRETGSGKRAKFPGYPWWFPRQSPQIKSAPGHQTANSWADVAQVLSPSSTHSWADAHPTRAIFCSGRSLDRVNAEVGQTWANAERPHPKVIFGAPSCGGRHVVGLLRSLTPVSAPRTIRWQPEILIPATRTAQPLNDHRQRSRPAVSGLGFRVREHTMWSMTEATAAIFNLRSRGGTASEASSRGPSSTSNTCLASSASKVGRSLCRSWRRQARVIGRFVMSSSASCAAGGTACRHLKMHGSPWRLEIAVGNNLRFEQKPAWVSAMWPSLGRASPDPRPAFGRFRPKLGVPHQTVSISTSVGDSRPVPVDAALGRSGALAVQMCVALESGQAPCTAPIASGDVPVWASNSEH